MALITSNCGQNQYISTVASCISIGMAAIAYMTADMYAVSVKAKWEGGLKDSMEVCVCVCSKLRACLCMCVRRFSRSQSTPQCCCAIVLARVIMNVCRFAGIHTRRSNRPGDLHRHRLWRLGHWSVDGSVRRAVCCGPADGG